MLSVAVTSPSMGQNASDSQVKDMLIPFELNEHETFSYETLMHQCQLLAKRTPKLNLHTMGVSEEGYDIPYLIFSQKEYAGAEEAISDGKLIWWINNGIHPGEPEGIDASFLFMRDLILRQAEVALNNMVIIWVPIYNVDGMRNRRGSGRINQDGPSAYGFRANARRLDLNRDFAKAVSAEAQAFQQLYSKWKPHVFLDTHCSNGADYQHTMTLIPTQKDKLGGPLAAYLEDTLLPELFTRMEYLGFPMSPYVQSRDGNPLNGINGFLDTPRYSTGYATLFHSMGFMTETHMLKLYKERVESTYAFMHCLFDVLMRDKDVCLDARKKQEEYYQHLAAYSLLWKRNDALADSIRFLGYEMGYRHSEISGQEIRVFDKSKPVERIIPYYQHFNPLHVVAIPEAYIIPPAYAYFAAHLSRNGIEFSILAKDSSMSLRTYSVRVFENPTRQIEGQFYRSDFALDDIQIEQTIPRGSLIVPLRQPGIRYLLALFEPYGADSFFRWNHFDNILQRKEYFSDYLMEPLAQSMMENDPELTRQFSERVAEDPEFAKSAYRRLDFFYQRSEHAEEGYLQYPIYRLMPEVE